jgi:hypothetical protein
MSHRRKLLRDLEAQGYQVIRSGSGHYQVRDSDGRLVTVVAGSPGGGRRSDDNQRAAIRRYERARQASSEQG